MWAQLLNYVWLFETPWAVACWAPLSVEFFRQEYRSGLPFLLQGIVPIQGSNPHLLHLLHCPVDSLPLRHLGSPCYLLILAPISSSSMSLYSIGVGRLKSVMKCSSEQFIEQERIESFFLLLWWHLTYKDPANIIFYSNLDFLFHHPVITLDCVGRCDIDSSSCSFLTPNC